MVPVEKPAVPPPKKKIDLNEPRVCKNKGCGKTYKEKDNHDEACDYHPGPAVFRDRVRGVCFWFKLIVVLLYSLIFAITDSDIFLKIFAVEML